MVYAVRKVKTLSCSVRQDLLPELVQIRGRIDGVKRTLTRVPLLFCQP
jgi:hypothetical protein